MLMIPNHRVKHDFIIVGANTSSSNEKTLASLRNNSVFETATMPNRFVVVLDIEMTQLYIRSFLQSAQISGNHTCQFENSLTIITDPRDTNF